MRHSEGPHTGLPSIPKSHNQTQTAVPPDDKTVNVAPPWKISAIQEGLGGKFDRETILEVLEQCRGNIDNAFMNLLGDENTTQPPEATASRAIMKSRIQPSSRSSSPFSTGSKRSAEDSDEDDIPRPASRRARLREHKRRVLPDVTVGIAFRDEENDLVSLRLRVNSDKSTSNSSAENSSEHTESSSESQRDIAVPRRGRRLKPRIKHKAEISESSSQQSETDAADKNPRRSQRITRSRSRY